MVRSKKINKKKCSEKTFCACWNLCFTSFSFMFHWPRVHLHHLCYHLQVEMWSLKKCVHVSTLHPCCPLSSCTCNPEPWAHTPCHGHTAGRHTGCYPGCIAHRGRVPHTCSEALQNQESTLKHLRQELITAAAMPQQTGNMV